MYVIHCLIFCIVPIYRVYTSVGPLVFQSRLQANMANYLASRRCSLTCYPSTRHLGLWFPPPDASHGQKECSFLVLVMQPPFLYIIQLYSFVVWHPRLTIMRSSSCCIKNGPVDLRPLGPERLRLGAPVGAGTGADGEAVQDLIPDAQHLNVMPHIVKKRQYRNRSWRMGAALRNVVYIYISICICLCHAIYIYIYVHVKQTIPDRGSI